jgi:hypothetical protein
MKELAMRKAVLFAVGALALPLVLSLPAVAAGLMERAQDEGMRQAQEASRKQVGTDHNRKQLGAAQSRHGSTTGAATTGAAPSEPEWNQTQAQPSKRDSDDAKARQQ